MDIETWVDMHGQRHWLARGYPWIDGGSTLEE